MIAPSNSRVLNTRSRSGFGKFSASIFTSSPSFFQASARTEASSYCTGYCAFVHVTRLIGGTGCGSAAFPERTATAPARIASSIANGTSRTIRHLIVMNSLLWGSGADVYGRESEHARAREPVPKRDELVAADVVARGGIGDAVTRPVPNARDAGRGEPRAVVARVAHREDDADLGDVPSADGSDVRSNALDDRRVERNVHRRHRADRALERLARGHLDLVAEIGIAAGDGIEGPHDVLPHVLCGLAGKESDVDQDRA